MLQRLDASSFHPPWGREGEKRRVFSLVMPSLAVSPGVLGLLEPEAGVASSPPLSPARQRFGSLLSRAGSS